MTRDSDDLHEERLTLRCPQWRICWQCACEQIWHDGSGVSSLL